MRANTRLNDLLSLLVSISLLLIYITSCADSPPPLTQSQGEIVGGVPDATIAAAKNDLTEKLGIPPDAIDLVMARAVTWNDGALGCGRPGQAYTQAIVPGYHLILEANGRRYDYRATEHGYLMLCESPSTLPPPVSR